MVMTSIEFVITMVGSHHTKLRLTFLAPDFGGACAGLAQPVQQPDDDPGIQAMLKLVDGRLHRL